MEIIRRIILFILAIIFGYHFTLSSTLAFIYHDLSLGLHYAIIGFIVFIVYLLIWWSDDIYYYLKNRKQEEDFM